jgi:hypothetical protein
MFAQPKDSPFWLGNSIIMWIFSDASTSEYETVWNRRRQLMVISCNIGLPRNRRPHDPWLNPIVGHSPRWGLFCSSHQRLLAFMMRQAIGRVGIPTFVQEMSVKSTFW